MHSAAEVIAFRESGFSRTSFWAVMLREFNADLHIHTCLSPCGSLDLSPRRIIEHAKMEALDIIAITDHNTARNVQKVMQLGEREGIKVIPGLEVQSREEIHLLTLFSSWESAAVWAEEVDKNLPPVRNEPEILGDQPVVDEEGNILEFEERLLLNSLNLSAEEISRHVHKSGGLTIASHYNRGAFSLLSQLGFIPPDMPLDALEISRQRDLSPGEVWTDGSRVIPQIVSSDAHRPEDIGSGRTVLLLAEATLDEVRLALARKAGRRIVKFLYKPLDPL